ncbi:hypothetical protein H9I38_09345 [Arthrobacter sp. UM1]|nr:hypothetical protein [Arthrobacter sp. UM1]
MLGISAVLLAFVLWAAALAQARAAAAQSAAAADLAALAAADAARGLVPGEPCDVAARTAEANRAVLRECSLEGETVTVRVAAARGLLLITPERRSRAGPPPHPSRPPALP